MTEKSSQIIDGITVPLNYEVDTFRLALNYQPRSDDIFLCVYPKSGTTWVQVILYTLMHDGEAFDENISEYFTSTLFIDEIGEEGINKMHHPYVIKTHLPFNRMNYDPKAKYVCVIRNPKDVCVSYYYFLMKIFNKEPDQTSFDGFFEEFIHGNTYHGDYFEYLKTIWRYKDKSNVLLISYEEMKHDLPNIIRQLAQFLNIELTDHLIDRVVTYSSFNYMRERFKKVYVSKAKIELADESSTAIHRVNKKRLEICDRFERVRKGIVGDWSSIMSEEQSQRFDKIYREKTKHMIGLEKFFSPE